MVRFSGQPLQPGCRIALITNDAIGNYVVVTPLIQMLQERYKPSALHYYGGARTEELWSKEPLITWGYPFHGSDPHMSVLNASMAGVLSDHIDEDSFEYDLVVNVEDACWAKCFAALISRDGCFVCGPSLGSDGRKDMPFPDDERGWLWGDKGWISSDLPQRYPFLNSGFIGEVLCRLCYLEGTIPAYKLAAQEPDLEIPDVLIATAASLPEKLWPAQKWRSALEWLRDQGLKVGLLGAPAKTQHQFWAGGDAEGELVGAGLAEDLRGRMTLPEVVGALDRAKIVLTLDNGIVHLAAATSTPTVGLFRHGIHRLWAPPVGTLTVLTPGDGRAVAEISTASVQEALSGAL